jgi:AbrB family looped-hinge helix DNA binding protein
MHRAVISSKGRETIPAELRKKLGLNPGTHVRWSKENEKLVLTPLTGRGAWKSPDPSKSKPTTND